MHINSKILLLLFLSSIGFTSLANFKSILSFGENPVELSASYLIPSDSANSLVIFLHGCTQNGELLAKQSGFVALAKKHDFMLLIPQQSEKNNVKSCFNWFSEIDNEKNKGENLSIYNMIIYFRGKTQVNNIYIAGVSAGGAMASVMLVNYPELFTSAAIISGLPYPCANNLTKAISCMRNGPFEAANFLTKEAIKQPHNQVSWPTLSVWVGDNDKVVNPINSTILAKQGIGLFNKPLTVVKTQTKSFSHTLWKDNNQNGVVELFEMNDLGHGMMISTKEQDGGIIAPYLLDSELSSAKEIIKFWNLVK
jgi:poly(hydroxyalkanoate) depolymerase family esterase